MMDPVITPAGHAYERRAIEEHVEAHGKDPLTGEGLRVDELRPNRNLRDAIEAWRESNR